jgi:hypothetical protein
MHFRATLSVAAAFGVLAATIFPFGLIPAADAHTGGGTVFQPHHIKTPPQVKSAPVDNVRDFGAVGNGVIDDTNAIQNAANDAAAHGKGVFFPNGVYLHAETITFSGVAVTGAGAGSILVANNVNACSVILTGNGVSIQNMVISTQGLVATPIPGPTAPPTNLILQTATNFTIAKNTFVQGSNMGGVLVQTASVGTITSNIFDGAGAMTDFGLIVTEGANITIASNLIQNTAIGIAVIPVLSSIPAGCFFIAITSNTIGNVTWPTAQVGIGVIGTNVLDIAQNTIQMANQTSMMSTPILLEVCDDYQVVGNNTWGGSVGMELQSSGPNGNKVTQNLIHNCGGSALDIQNTGGGPSGPFASSIQASSNVFGESGLVTAAPVINISGPAGADASGATTLVQNNSYQGHLNLLNFLVKCSFTVPHIPPSNVTGNTQTQTTLSNSI